MSTTADLQSFSLKDKYLKEEGSILLSGIQALVRLPIDQHRADMKAGLKTATIISGYRGSPLGGYDTMLMREKKLLEEHDIHFMRGVNEDLAATAVYGGQIANLLPKPTHDGVVGIWYGKAPGVDRSGDVLKHANMVGTSRSGGVLALAGDDPFSKSSTLPSASEYALLDAMMPVLYPGNVEEILTLGRYGIELSRYCGLWVGFKIVTDVADAFATAEVSPIEDIVFPEFKYEGKPWVHQQNPTLLPHISLMLEKEMYHARILAAEKFSQANGLNRIVERTGHDRLGIIAAGKTYYDLREALDLLGVRPSDHGIRIMKLGMIFPMERETLTTFAEGLEEILVIEEKRSFIEVQVRDRLYNMGRRPKVYGKLDVDGSMLVRAESELLVSDVISILIRKLPSLIGDEPILRYKERVAKKIDQTFLDLLSVPLVPRTPYFCSGCPHNTSTNVPEGSLAGGGIGCHGLGLLMDRGSVGLLHMGGEGVPWVGASVFSKTPHMFQNMGDGTLSHSGYLAIRQAVVSNTNITYKILYNAAVAMTGGQPAEIGMGVPELTRALEAEGVSKIIVCADDPGKYPRSAKWGKGVDVWHRDRLDEAQEILRSVDGVTVLIYDQPCAADLRRKRKRGLAPTPKRRIFINELVCEGCGDCGVKSNCLSVFPVETEFGRKTQIHQSSCNLDFSCTMGDCPAFVQVEGEPVRRSMDITNEILEISLPEPTIIVPDDANIYMVGIGGTGVVTINQILATAAFVEGKRSTNLDQTGLSQKGGSVISHIKLSTGRPNISNRVPRAEADTLILFDMLAGVSEGNLAHSHPDRTIAVASTSKIPTGRMVASKEVQFPELTLLNRRLEGHVRNVYTVDAIELSETLFGTHLPANMILIGAAYQMGSIPISEAAIMRAIEINGVAVEMNKKAFRTGRLAVEDPSNFLDSVRYSRSGEIELKPDISPEAKRLIARTGAEGELQRLLRVRVPELIDYQNVKYAEKYVNLVEKAMRAEKKMRNSTVFTESVARYYYKLLAYKDEYEVARLYLKPEFAQALRNSFGGAKYKYLLHPPIFRGLGRKRKMAFGTWFNMGYKVLRAMRRLRGTPFDIFGYTRVRRLEREIIREYEGVIEQICGDLQNIGIDKAVQIAELPDIIRGYEEIKEQNVLTYREKLAELLP